MHHKYVRKICTWKKCTWILKICWCWFPGETYKSFISPGPPVRRSCASFGQEGFRLVGVMAQGIRNRIEWVDRIDWTDMNRSNSIQLNRFNWIDWVDRSDWSDTQLVQSRASERQSAASPPVLVPARFGAKFDSISEKTYIYIYIYIYIYEYIFLYIYIYIHIWIYM